MHPGALVVRAGTRLGGADVVDALTRIAARRGVPGRIHCDNGSEFCGWIMDLWAYHHGVRMEFSRPGKPTDHAPIEAFNGRLRDECLNAHWFESIDDAKTKIEAWRRHYNESRPHRGLDNLSPCEYQAQWANQRPETL